MLMLLFPLSGCGGLTYSINAANYGTHGVILLDMPVTGGFAGKPPHPGLRLSPGIPTVRDDKRWIGRFRNHDQDLPSGNMEISWKLAKLTNCKDIVRIDQGDKMQRRISKAGYRNPTSYMRKSNCTWTPIKGKVFHKTLDMDAIRNSEAYKKAGSPYPSVQGSKNVLRILLVFNEDQLEVKTYNAHTNPWQ